MKKIIDVLIHGKMVRLNLTIAKRTARRYHFSYGEIQYEVSAKESLKNIVRSIESSFPKNKLNKFSNDFLIGSDYIYILGNKLRLVNLKVDVVKNKEDFTYVKEEEIVKKLKRFALDILTSRVKQYEKIMNIPIEHTVKITSMSAARGKNYYAKDLITFDYHLIHFSLELIDSVVIHELAHYFQQNHSSDFYDIVKKYCPDYKIKSEKLTYGVKN